MKEEFISFLKKHNLYDREIINSFLNKSFIDEDIRYSGCLYIIDNKNILLQVRACVPTIVDYRTMLVNIHEYVHYYIVSKKIGQKVIIGRNCEVLPMLYEKIFIIEKNEEDLNEYDNFLNDSINKEDFSYVYALEIREKLIKLFDRCGKIKRMKKKNSY